MNATLVGIRSVIVFAAVMRLALRYRRRYHPFPTFGPANTVTTLRAALVSVAAGLIGEPGVTSVAWTAAAAGLAATLLDGVDGWLARRTRMASEFGARFDVEVDALLIQVLAILAWRFDKAGVWVLASGLLRYAFVVAGWIWPWLAGPLEPTRRAKVICVVQIAALLIVVLPFVPPRVAAPIAAGALAALAYSFAVDIIRLWRTR